MAAIYDSKRPVPSGYDRVRASVGGLDTKQHPLHNIPAQTVPVRRYSPLGPTRKGAR